jgi:hypothetical protein
MATIKLAEGFKNLKIGDAQTLAVKRVRYDEKYQKIIVTFADAEGGTLTERFNLVGSNGKPNDVALGVFSTLYKCCMGGKTGDEVDPCAIEGRRVVADVWEQIVKDKDTREEKARYIHVRNFHEAEPAAADDDDDLFA